MSRHTVTLYEVVSKDGVVLSEFLENDRYGNGLEVAEREYWSGKVKGKKPHCINVVTAKVTRRSKVKKISTKERKVVPAAALKTPAGPITSGEFWGLPDSLKARYLNPRGESKHSDKFDDLIEAIEGAAPNNFDIERPDQYPIETDESGLGFVSRRKDSELSIGTLNIFGRKELIEMGTEARAYSDVADWLEREGRDLIEAARKVRAAGKKAGKAPAHAAVA